MKKYYNIRVIRAKSKKEAIEKLIDGDIAVFGVGGESLLIGINCKTGDLGSDTCLCLNL